jgi:Transmembrane secretion effector
VAAVFGLNTATFLLYALVLVSHPRLGGTPQSPERFIPGLRAGGRYVRRAPVVQRTLLRAALFLLPASALWALLPLIATRRLGLGSGGYGVLLGALGIGAIAGAFGSSGASRAHSPSVRSCRFSRSSSTAQSNRKPRSMGHALAPISTQEVRRNLST